MWRLEVNQSLDRKAASDEPGRRRERERERSKKRTRHNDGWGSLQAASLLIYHTGASKLQISWF